MREWQRASSPNLREFSTPLPRRGFVRRWGLRPTNCPWRAEHHFKVPRTGRNGCGIRAVGRSDATAPERCDPIAERGIHLLGRNIVDMRVRPARGQNAMFSGNRVGRRTYRQVRVYPVHSAGVARFANPDNFSAFDADIGFDDTQGRFEHNHIGDDQIEGAPFAGQLVVHAEEPAPHPVRDPR